jgi:hypothetical protein
MSRKSVILLTYRSHKTSDCAYAVRILRRKCENNIKVVRVQLGYEWKNGGSPGLLAVLDIVFVLSKS